MAESDRTVAPATIFLIILTLLGFWLRFRCLGCLGFHGDEDLTSLAVKALSATGVPELPSGMIYLRFYPYQWLLLISTSVFGFSEFSLRLPAVLFGTALIPASYIFAKQVANERIALIVAVGIALSFWQVDVSRMARMYAPFFLFYLLAATAIYRAHFADPQRHWAPLALALSLLALAIHQLAYSLAVLFLLAIPLNPNARRSAALIAQAGIIAVAFVVSKKVEEYFFFRAAALSGATQPGSDTGGGIVAGLLKQIVLPDFGLLAQAYHVSAAASLALGLLALGLLALVWRKASGLGSQAKAALLIAVACAALQQFNLSVVMLALAVAFNQKDLATLRSPAWQAGAAAVTLLFIVWAGAVFLLSTTAAPDAAPAAIGLRKALRQLVDYPNFRLFWSFVTERPILALPLASGTLWCLGRIARPKPDPAALFLAGGFWGVLFANAVLKTKFEFFRYNLHLDVFYMTLVALGLVGVPGVWAAITQRQRPEAANGRRMGALLAISAAVVVLGVRPESAWFTASRGYYETAWIYRALDMERHPDFESPASYVRQRLRPGDKIFVFDPREFWNYLGRVDYWIYSDNYQSQSFFDGAVYRDMYVGVPVLATLTDIEQALGKMTESTAWLIYSRERLERTPWVSGEIKAFVASLEDRVVYTGLDHATVVIRISRDAGPTS